MPRTTTDELTNAVNIKQLLAVVIKNMKINPRNSWHYLENLPFYHYDVKRLSILKSNRNPAKVFNCPAEFGEMLHSKQLILTHINCIKTGSLLPHAGGFNLCNINNVLLANTPRQLLELRAGKIETWEALQEQLYLKGHLNLKHKNCVLEAILDLDAHELWRKNRSLRQFLLPQLAPILTEEMADFLFYRKCLRPQTIIRLKLFLAEELPETLDKPIYHLTMKARFKFWYYRWNLFLKKTLLD